MVQYYLSCRIPAILTQGRLSTCGAMGAPDTHLVCQTNRRTVIQAGNLSCDKLIHPQAVGCAARQLFYQACGWLMPGSFDDPKTKAIGGFDFAGVPWPYAMGHSIIDQRTIHEVRLDDLNGGRLIAHGSKTNVGPRQFPMSEHCATC